MRLTSKGRYALRAALALARMGTNGKMVSINALSKEENISSVFLEQIFFKLRRAGIVKSARGPGGGFSFVRPLESLSVFEILYASGEELVVLPCDRREKECGRQGECIAHQVIISVGDLVNNYLKELSLKTVLEDKKYQPKKNIIRELAQIK